LKNPPPEINPVLAGGDPAAIYDANGSGWNTTHEEIFREWVYTEEQNIFIGDNEYFMPRGGAAFLSKEDNWYLLDQTNPRYDRWFLDALNVFPDDHELQSGLLSINQAKYPAWAAAMSGIEVDRGIYAYPGPEMEDVVHGINRQRQGKSFNKFSDILEAPELSIESPYALAVPLANRTEEHYEALTRGLLPLLRLDEEDRYVAYAYSQVLRPARRGITASSITNYKVVGEAAARTVFKVDARKQVILESYTPMKIR